MANTLFKEPPAPLTYLAVTIGFSLVVPLILLGATIGLTLIIPNLVIDTTFLTVYFLVACTLYNIFLLLIISRGHVEEGEDVAHYFSILIPAHNEEDVIGETLEHIVNLDYPHELFEIIVVNDGSKDNTERIVQSFQKKHPHLKLINVSVKDGGKGKGSALNTGFANFLLTWRGLEIRPRHRWIIGVFDSDAIPDSNMLKKVSFQFNNPHVGGVQTQVRIKNRKKSFLANMQHIEFLAFARVVQFARTVFKGSVALGGNGQFVRATALETVALKHLEEYWKRDSLTEDLEMGVRLITKKWENRYVGSTAVYQEGAEKWSILLRQRTRWAWGTLQTLEHYVLNLKLWKAKVSLKKKVDVSIYLVHIMLPFLVLLCWIWFGLSLFGIIRISNAFPLAFCVANGFSFLPFYGYGLWKERKEYPRWQIIPLMFIATAYTYHWIPCITSAIIKMITRKPTWSKTPHGLTKQTSIKNSIPTKRTVKL
jgi:cellulose synthase/poly-beta-1,6-N-acetylglucosamine synthase-like glycosyltransferase